MATIVAEKCANGNIDVVIDDQGNAEKRDMYLYANMFGCIKEGEA